MAVLGHDLRNLLAAVAAALDPSEACLKVACRRGNPANAALGSGHSGGWYKARCIMPPFRADDGTGLSIRPKILPVGAVRAARESGSDESVLTQRGDNMHRSKMCQVEAAHWLREQADAASVGADDIARPMETRHSLGAGTSSAG